MESYIDAYIEAEGLTGLVTPQEIMTVWIVIAAIGLLSIIAMWKIFRKAGKPGWASLIPIYCPYTEMDIIFPGQGWKFLLFLIPIYNIYFLFKTNIRLAKAFGYSTIFGLGLVFFSPIFYLILAFGSHEYEYADDFLSDDDSQLEVTIRETVEMDPVQEMQPARRAESARRVEPVRRAEPVQGTEPVQNMTKRYGGRSGNTINVPEEREYKNVEDRYL